MKHITIIGGGPAALMLAANLDTQKYKVTLNEQKKTVGRKFLVAGEGGLNLTFSSPLDDLIEQYSPSDYMAPYLKQFTNEDLMRWLKNIGISTFVGSSNRVFPTPDLKPIDVLSKIVKHLSSKDIEFRFETKWTGWNNKGLLCFEESKEEETDITVFSLGGASWKVTGSDGSWSAPFAERGINVLPFRAANCAFGVDWNKNFIATHQGKPLKNIALTFDEKVAKGELVITKFGLEGNAIYALSEKLQEALLNKENVVLQLDLKPSMTLAQIKKKFSNSGLSKVTDILKEDINLDRSTIGLLKQFSDKETFMNPDLLATTIKSVPIPIASVDDIDKAISTLGGIDLDEVDGNFQLNKIHNSYVIGEMLDWYAPTGGYLLHGCFSMGYSLANHLNSL
ncbi:TIGR03862 family flavoprotein [Bacteroidia bacterium]|nr:TIGR03862 family flavoprotein [Bacteroidia bacterium]MDB4107465.1 TIGR03862 family flavoprotein [Bacteroidia bacterium]